MRCQGAGYQAVLLVAAVALLLGCSSLAVAQAPQSGVAVDAKGVLHMKSYADPSGMLTRQRIAAAKASLDPQVVAYSKDRFISLNRLEAAVRAAGGVPTDEMRNLAGLLRVKYVFFYPESGDVVIGGPAEGWMTNQAGRVLGITSGRPVVRLDDLVVALRAFPANGEGADLVGCSIDPTPEGLMAMQQFLRSIGSVAIPGQDAYIVAGLKESLGLHSVRIEGVSPKTHFAQVLVEADYRMKLIGIGLERPPIRLASYVDRVRRPRGNNAMERWYFTPDYNCVRISEDGLAMELVGDGVKLIGENEMVTADGQRHRASRGNPASQSFVNDFTKKYGSLAERSPVYAELRNLIDLTVASAYIQQEDYCGRANWDMDFFGNEESFSVERLEAPKTVETAATAVWKGSTRMTPVGGGVTINAGEALAADNLLSDDDKDVAKKRSTTKLELAEGQWWWD